LPKGWLNLSQVGGSALTGLELVYRRSTRPRFVLVESNVFGWPDRGLKKDMIDEVTFPGVSRWRCDHRILQHKYRPVDVLVSAAAQMRRSAQGRSTNDPSAAADGPAGAPETAEQRKDRLDGIRIQVEEQSRPPSDAALNGQVTLVLERCRQLARAGTRCLLFEMPVDAEVSASPFATAVRARMKAALPDAEFPWLPWIDPASVRTTDGVHLAAESARRVTNDLVRWVDSRRAAR
jgi:hypothetical protein